MSTTNLGLNIFNGSDYVDVSKFNENFSTIDTLGVAYIAETGTNSVGWYYRKWSDGCYEAWLNKSAQNIATTIGSGDGYRSKDITIKLPVTFSENPTVVITPYDGTNTTWASMRSISNSVATLFFMSFDKATRSIGYSVYVSGKVS